MKVLIIDDSEYKVESLQALLGETSLASEVKVAKSFQSGIRALQEFRPDLVLLDMTLPTSERSDGHLEGRTRLFGGRELLAEMEFASLSPKVIIVTQFDHFGEPPTSITLKELLNQLKNRFPTLVIGGVYYDNLNSGWTDELRPLLQQLPQ